MKITKLKRNHETLIPFNNQGFEINNVDGDYGSNTSSMMQNLIMLVAAAVLIYLRRKKILKFINTSEYVAHVVTVNPFVFRLLSSSIILRQYFNLSGHSGGTNKRSCVQLCEIPCIQARIPLLLSWKAISISN